MWAGLRVEISCFSTTSTDALNMVGTAVQPVIRKSFINTLVTVKSSDFRSEAFRLYHSSPYINTGTHLLNIRCKKTSSDATLPTLPKIVFTALKNERLHFDVEHLNNLELTI